MTCFLWRWVNWDSREITRPWLQPPPEGPPLGQIVELREHLSPTGTQSVLLIWVFIPLNGAKEQKGRLRVRWPDCSIVSKRSLSSKKSWGSCGILQHWHWKLARQRAFRPSLICSLTLFSELCQHVLRKFHFWRTIPVRSNFLLSIGVVFVEVTGFKATVRVRGQIEYIGTDKTDLLLSCLSSWF